MKSMTELAGGELRLLRGYKTKEMYVGEGGGMTAYRGMFAHPSTDREA